jgi:hypothetical protein
MEEVIPMTRKIAPAIFFICLLYVFASRVSAGCCDRDTKMSLAEGPNLRVWAVWNAPERAGGDYAAESWPQGELAADRAFLFAARLVLRDEWDISKVIAEKHPGGGFAQLVEAETNYYKNHADHPAHFHINYIWPGFSGHVNTHFHTSSSGRVRRAFVLYNVPGCPSGETYPPAGSWWAEIDENCRPVWLQSWTADGAVQLKHTDTSPVYTLRGREVSGDLSSSDVYLDGQKIYAVDITEYDPTNLRMVVVTSDFRRSKRITETFTGTVDPWKALASHTAVESPLEEPLPPPAPAPAVSCTRYVSTSGQDASPGTFDRPWRTAAKAASSAQAGDTVCFRAGTWNERLRPQNSGRAEAPITFTAYPGEEGRVVFDLGQPLYDSSSRGLGIVHIDGRSFITVSNLRLVNSGYYGVFVRQSSSIQILNNQLDTIYASGIIAMNSVSSLVIDGNDLQRVTHRQGGSDQLHESISLLLGVEDFEIRNNHIHNPFVHLDGSISTKEGIDVKQGVRRGRIYNNTIQLGRSTGIYIDAYDRYAEDIEVYNNLSYNNGNGLVVAAEGGGTVSRISIYNNVIHSNSSFGIRIVCWQSVFPNVTCPASEIRIVNNTVTGNRADGIEISNPYLTSGLVRNNISLNNGRYNLWIRPSLAGVVGHDSNLTNGEAGFVNPAAGDFRLSPGSAAIDAGEAAGAPGFDQAGLLRPQGPRVDIGAYEYPVQGSLPGGGQGVFLPLVGFGQEMGR